MYQGTQTFWLRVTAATCRISLIQCRPPHVNEPTGMEANRESFVSRYSVLLTVYINAYVLF